MSTALATLQTTTVSGMTESDLIGVLQTSLYPGATIGAVKMVLGYCKAANLDPMQKPVHIVPMFDKATKSMRDVVMPGIGLYRTQAARSGQYAGVTDPEFGPDITETIGGVQLTFPAWCRITVKRMLGHQVVEFGAKEFWKENYATAGRDSAAPNAMWKKRPYGQIAKCAEAQALRKAFPEFGSAPTADEMEGAAYPEQDTAAPIKTVERDTVMYPADQFAANLPKWRDAIASGKKTAEQIIAMVSSKGALTDEQKAAIAAPPPAATTIDQPTFASVAEAIAAATDEDAVDAAADLIGGVPDASERDQLGQRYRAKRAELAG